MPWSAATVSAGAASSGGDTMICTASPSSDGTGGLTSVAAVAVVPAAPSTVVESCSGRFRSSAGSTRSPSDSAVTTTIAGAEPESWKSPSRSLTFVDSADSGRNEDWSFVATSLISPNFGPPTAATPSHIRMSDAATALLQKVREPAGGAYGMMDSLHLMSVCAGESQNSPEPGLTGGPDGTVDGQ